MSACWPDAKFYNCMCMFQDCSETCAVYIWLCGVKVPPRGGETLFASAAAAVEALPAEQLALLESLDCEHRCTALPYN